MPVDEAISGTEERLLDSAEALFAERGVGAVSLRAVMQDAGTNVAAIHYHFGSKEALLDAVVRRRIDAVTDARAALLDDLGQRATARDLAHAFIEPVAAVAADGGRAWIQVIGQLLATNDPALAPVSESFFARNGRFVDLMARLDPPPSALAVGFRLTQAMSVTLSVLGDVEHVRDLLGGTCTPPTVDAVASELLDVVTAILAGPPAT